MFLLSIEYAERLKISADWFYLLILQTVLNYSALKLTCGIIKHKCRIYAKIIFNQSAEQKREYQYEDRTECK